MADIEKNEPVKEEKKPEKKPAKAASKKKDAKAEKISFEEDDDEDLF